MGTLSELTIAKYPILTIKNTYFSDVVNLIFSKSDFVKKDRKLKERNEIVWGDTFKDNNDIEEYAAFVSEACKCKERLELFGASYKTAKSDFELAIQELKEDDLYKFFNLETISYDSYLSLIKKIINSKTRKFDVDYNSSFESYLIENELMVEYQSPNLALWSILSVLDKTSIIEYDLTDLIRNGWAPSSPNNEVVNEKIIVLTEGKTDTRYIKIAINNFFPHLSDFYHFMDFETSKYEGNASRLVHTIKSFVGSGIKNRIIALFDNDSAALKEIKNLEKINLPPNIKVFQYPNLELAKEYPTIGPTGVQYMNVNGLAGSIEMYLGKDCLTIEEGLSPIQWKGYIESIERYQGVVMNKSLIQKNFKEKCDAFNSSNYSLSDWKDLISIIEMLNKAWQN